MAGGADAASRHGMPRAANATREERDVCESRVHPTPTVACVTGHATPGTLEWACVTDCGAAAAGRQTSVGLDDRSSQTSVAATHQTLAPTQDSTLLFRHKTLACDETRL